MAERGRPTRAGPARLLGGFDGGSDAGPRSRSRSVSRGRSRTRDPVGPMPDPRELNRRLELGPDGYKFDYDDLIGHMKRPGFTKGGGREITVRVNAYRVESIPTKSVWQYDVLIGKGEKEKRATIRAVWNSQILQSQLGAGWIFDGNKLAWSLQNIGQKTFHVDLDKEKGKESRTDNTFRVQLRPTKKIPMAALEAYKNQTTSFGTEVLEAINFLDHLLREFPSKKLLAIKRSFFHRELAGKHDLGNGIVAVKGIYQSLRVAEGKQLIINADVANTTFWNDGPLSFAITELSAPVPEHEISNVLGEDTNRNLVLKHQLSRLKLVRITVDYNNIPEISKGRMFVIEEVLNTNAKATTFVVLNKNEQIIKEISVWDYFLKEKKHRVTRPWLPVIRTTKGQLFPAEVCTIAKGQRYNFRLNEFQTAQMIKFAVTRPNVRSEAINNGIKAVDWANDVYHKNYGLKINPSMIETKARVLITPSVEFRGGKSEKPGISGRWRIDGKQFIRPFNEPLKRWAVCVFNMFSRDPRSHVNENEAKLFMEQFIIHMRNYGGVVESGTPPIIFNDDVKNGVDAAWERAKADSRPPQILFFILNGKITHYYNRIKKNCECKFGVVSQCIQSVHVKKKDPQYIGNVMMKVFAKLGGFAFRANPNQSIKPGQKLESVMLLPPRTMVIGADVSHAGPGSFAPSMAAITVAMDHSAMRFAAGVQTNGHREEMITSWNWVDVFIPLMREWVSHVGGGQYPKHVFYFRDGVSEGQYQHVLQQELRDMKHVFRILDQSGAKKASAEIKWTVVIASKRHHFRFFPPTGSGDKHGNVFPGTVIERDITHPFEYDFYLNSHVAIQGTARPTHYHVLIDESGGSPDALVKLIYNLCYQYARSSTPVSIIPAVYYAHLASKRAMAHERREADENFKYTGKDLSEFVELSKARAVCDRTGKVMTKPAVDRLRELCNMKAPLLLGLPESGRDPNKIRYSMWYI